MAVKCFPKTKSEAINYVISGLRTGVKYQLHLDIRLRGERERIEQEARQRYEEEKERERAEKELCEWLGSDCV